MLSICHNHVGTITLSKLVISSPDSARLKVWIEGDKRQDIWEHLSFRRCGVNGEDYDFSEDP